MKVERLIEEGLILKIRDEFETGRDYEIRAQIFNGAALPKEKGDFSIKISFSGVSTETKLKTSLNHRIN